MRPKLDLGWSLVVLVAALVVASAAGPASAQTITTLYVPDLSTTVDAQPGAVAARPTGGFAVAFPKIRQVRLYSATGQLDGTVTVPGRPLSVVVLNGGDLLVGDGQFGEVGRYAPDGRKVGFLGSGPGEFKQPLDIDVDRAQQRVYVVDAKNDHLRVFTLDGQDIGTIGATGTQNGQFRRPVSVWVDPPSGALHVADFQNQRVQIFTKTGAFSSAFGVAGDGVGELMRPRSVAVDGQGRVLVSDSFQGWVQAFSPAGTYLGHAAFYGKTAGKLRNAGDIAVDSANRLVASSTGTSRVERFTNLLGGTLAFPTTPEPIRAAEVTLPAAIDFEASALPIRVEIWGANWQMIDASSVRFNQTVKAALIRPATGVRPAAFDAVFRIDDLLRWAKENRVRGNIPIEITGNLEGGGKFAGSTVLVIEKGGGKKPPK